MNSQEMLEDFLIKMGCKLVTNYKYIDDNSYDYLQGITEDVIKVGTYNIPITTKLFNMKNLFWDLKYASLKCLLDIQQQMLQAVESGYNNDKIAELGDFAINSVKVYITDFLKYAMAKFHPDEKLTYYLISLAATAITTVNNEMIKKMEKYQIKLSNAHMDAINYQNQLNQQTAAAAAAAPKQTFVSTTYYDSDSVLWNDYSLSYGTTKSTVSESEVNASFAANATLSSMLESSGMADAGSGTIKEIGKLTDDIMIKFNDDFAEILVFKLENLFDQNAYNHVESVELNPLDLKNWIEPLKTIPISDYDNLKKISDTYGLAGDLGDYLAGSLCDQEYQYYITNKKCDYRNDQFQLFEMLAVDRDEYNQKLSTNLYNYYRSEMKNNPSQEKLLKDEINNCDYLADDKKNSLTTTIVEHQKEHASGIVSSVIQLVIALALLFPVYKVHAWIQYMYVNDVDQFRTDIQTRGYLWLAIVLYIPIAVISIGIFAFLITRIINFIKSLKK